MELLLKQIVHVTEVRKGSSLLRKKQFTMWIHSGLKLFAEINLKWLEGSKNVGFFLNKNEINFGKAFDFDTDVEF